MNAGSGDTSADDVSTLIRTLQDTERRLQDLVAGKVGAVPEGDATWRAGILDALPANIALLDRDGFIVAVNDGWREFARSNALGCARFGIGTSYLEPCDRARALGCPDAAAAAEGIRAVLDGTSREFSIEYPCHWQDQRRWYLLKATPLTGDGGAMVMHLDITERRLAELRSRDLAERLTTTLDSMSDAFFTIDRDWRFTFLNRQAEQLLGRSRDQLLGRTLWSSFPDSVGSLCEREYRRSLAEGISVAFEESFEQGDIWFSVRAYPSEHGLAVYFRDITQGRRAAEALRASEAEFTRGLRESERRIARLNRVYAVLSQINALILRRPGRDELFREACRVAVELGEFRFAWVGLLDHDGDRLAPTASAGDVTDFFERAPHELFDCRSGAAGRLAQALHERELQVVNDLEQQPKALMGKDLEERGIRAFAIIPLVVHGGTIGVLALYAREAGFFDEEEMRLLQELAGNISLAIEHIEKQERLDYLAYYDPLTGLANRTLFLDRVAQHMRSAASRGHAMALFVFDLERFKNINDSLGRMAGDALLRKVADWMTGRSGDASLLARVGSNHFAAVVPRVDPGGDLTQVIENAMGALGSHPFEVGDAVLRVTAKVGAAIPDERDSAESLFQNAEAALKHAKANADRYLFHSSAMTAAVAGKLSLENELRRALDNEEFVLHYQPKVNASSGLVTSAEALIRWDRPGNGLVPPGQFIPVLEETGLIHEVGRWAMRKAVEDYLRWCDAGLPAVRIAVNVSSLQLRSRSFVAEVAQALAGDPRAAAGLELEITESMVMGDINHGIASLQAIRTMGVSVALDDFGTGFSSLSYLARLPIDRLKIDRSFINEMADSPEGLALVRTIITLAHSLRLKVVAEGVETEEQSRLLRCMDCDELQGFHFGRPVPFAAFQIRPC
ncbi:EAL domain-containing protein [Alkalisalibacterium limincola]|uniref:cyclic-guanylate-specific phosphodiesterase n=1 Tax=Alkalisalibacterium limincola TaxID=2699169 RepID=A0A5C8KNX2_9GAMM|nr:EAL domain-containing protein [Alkalisalibacterium limincola]